MSFIGISIFSNAQTFPKNYFVAPLDTPLVLLGTFGEIRKNHFHSGIDLSTNQQEGKPVYSAADGFVSRIKISNGGFGKAIYISHPNGFVTVYGHLKKFNKTIQAYILKAQYEQKSYEVELKPAIAALIVKKNEVIAFSGNTGDSDGPHLHFEIRDRASEEPINPLHFGLKVNDIVPPVITNFRIFPVKGYGVLNHSDTPSTYKIRKTQSGYALIGSEPIQVFGSVGFGIEATDSQPPSQAMLGIYSATLIVDQTIIYQFKMDRINFNDMRYVNAHIDYRSKLLDNNSIQRCFRLPGNHLNLYSTVANDGYYQFTDNNTHDLEMTVSDFNGNRSTLNLKILSNPGLKQKIVQPGPMPNDWISEQKGLEIEKPGIKIVIPPGAVYDTYPFESTTLKNAQATLCPVFRVGDRLVPVHTSITISIDPGQLPEALKQKAAIVSMNRPEKLEYEGGSWNGRFLTSKVKYFGDFTVLVDTIAPVVIKKYSEATLRNTSTLNLTISDELSGILSYHATVDGKWLLMEYTKNGNQLTGDVSTFAKNKKHHLHLVLTVTDRKNNKTVFEDYFFR